MGQRDGERKPGYHAGGDIALACFLAVLSIGVIVSAIRMPRPDEGWSEAPGLFPLICGLGLLIMAAILTMTARRQSAGKDATPAGTAPAGDPASEQGVLWRTLLVIASVLVYALVLIPLLGYTIATFIYLVAVIWYFWRGKLPWVLLISLGATLFLSQTFQRAFSIVLP